MLATTDAPATIAPDSVAEVYDARTGAWSERAGAEVVPGNTVIDDGRVLRVTSAGVEVRGHATSADLADAAATWVAETAHRTPSDDDWVLVLGDDDDAGHRRLFEVDAGDSIAFQGRVLDTADADGDGRLEVRWSGDVLGQVVNTFSRTAPEVIDAEIVYADDTSDTLTGTPNHPFWVDAVRDYVPLGELEVGTVLHVQGGGEAILVSKTWRQGEFEVFDFEVEGLHNFYVRDEGSDAAGVLVHNSRPSISPQARGRASEVRVLDDLGLDANTSRVSTSEGRSIPDAIDDGAFYEIKDTKTASNTRQMRIQREAAAAEGRDHIVITGTNTRVSGPLEEASIVVRRDDLGPQ